MESISADQFLGLLDDPGCRENVGGQLLYVDLSSAQESASITAERLLRFHNLPAVVVGLQVPGGEPSSLSLHQLVDVVFDRDDANLLALSSTFFRRSNAAITLALLLRQTFDTTNAALVAESTAYSMLQGGGEFVSWKESRPVRPDARTAPDPVVSTEPIVVIERDDNVLRLTLNRPTKHNAFNVAMRDELCEALLLASIDSSIARIVINGNGPSFCSGGDLDEFGSRPDPVAAHIIRLTRSVAQLMHEIGSRTEVHLHGACLGAGIELSAFAERVTADPNVAIGLPEIDLGLLPGSGGTVSVRARIGRHRTAYLALTGAHINASTALAWGLIDGIT